MLGDERSKLREAEHLTLGVVSLYQPVAVEEGCFASVQDGLLLLIAPPRHEAQGHSSCPQLLGRTITVKVGQVVACVGVGEATALRLKDGVEAGDEHVGWDASQQGFVDPLKYLPRRSGVQGLGYRPEHVGGRLCQ